MLRRYVSVSMSHHTCSYTRTFIVDGDDDDDSSSPPPPSLALPCEPTTYTSYKVYSLKI